MNKSQSTSDSHVPETEIVEEQLPLTKDSVPSNVKMVSIGIIGIVAVALAFFVQKDSIYRVQTRIDVVEETPTYTPTPTPFLFQELTIPYLREQSYTSSLGELQVAYETNSYTAYQTSFMSDGFRVNGILTVPHGDMFLGGWPAIIFVHGYIPPTLYQPRSNYYDYVDFLARNGFVVFKIDLRGHAESEGEAGGAYYSSDYIIDVLSARAALQTADFVSPDAIGLWGHSMAGNVVFRTLVASGRIPAAVIWAGAVYTYEDMQEHGIDDNSYRPPSTSSTRQQKRQELRDRYGNFTSDSEFWQMVVPTNYLEDVNGAIQIHHATDDPVVSIEYSRGLMHILDATEIEHELYEYPSGGHNITGSSFTSAMQRTVEFFHTHLTQ